MRITRLTVDNLTTGCITDEPPTFAFALASDLPGEGLARATVRVGDWQTETREQVGIVYDGPLDPFTEYEVVVDATGTSGARATSSTTFRTGRLGTGWTARWITDLSYRTPRKQSPTPMAFRTRFVLTRTVRRAWLEATALGVYELELNGSKVGQDYFAPGFTSYTHQLQYQTYDVTHLVAGANELVATVAGGWAVGSYTFARKNRIYADRQAFLCELHVEYEDGSTALVATGPDWQVTTSGPVRMAEWYDGETYDATVSGDQIAWTYADVTAPRGHPAILAQYGPPVRAQRTLSPVAQTIAPSGEVVYDFGQNFAEWSRRPCTAGTARRSSSGTRRCSRTVSCS